MGPTGPASGSGSAPAPSPPSAPVGQAPVNPPAPDGKPPSPETTKRKDSYRLAVLSAVATVVAGLLSGVVAVSTNTVEISVPNGGPTRDDLKETVTSLENENADLQHTVDSLTSTTESPVTDVPTTSPSPLGDLGVSPRVGKALQVIAPHRIDLDSDTPDWGVATSDITKKDIAPSGGSSGLSLSSFYEAQVAFMPKPPSLSDCQQATALDRQTTTRETVPGADFCVRTTEGAYVYVHIVSVDPPRGSVTIDVNRWEQ